MRQFTLLFALLLSIPALTQESATFVVGNVRGDDGMEVCVPVTAMNFTGGVEFSFSLSHRTDGGLVFTRVTEYNKMLPDFGAGELYDHFAG